MLQSRTKWLTGPPCWFCDFKDRVQSFVVKLREAMVLSVCQFTLGIYCPGDNR